MGTRILVVESIRPAALAITSVLARHDHRVTTVGSVADANRHPERFDCGVFSDTLPDGNGISLAGWLLAEDRVACVVFFGHAEDIDTQLRASNLGTFVQRSKGLHALSEAITEAIADTQRARAVGADDSYPPLRAELKSGKRRRR